MDPNIVFSETHAGGIGAGRVVTPRATPEEIIKIAAEIWREVRAQPDTESANAALLERLQTSQQNFVASFPLVLRWMVQMRQYEPSVFHAYLLKHSGAKFDTREDFLKFQGEYLVMMYKHAQVHADERKVREYRTFVCESLLREDAEFAKIQEEVTEIVKREAADLDAERRRAIYELLMRQRARLDTPSE